MKRVFFEHGRIIDGLGTPAVEDGLVVISVPEHAGETGRVLYAGMTGNTLLKPGKEDDVVDIAGYSLLPGIFDCHVHLWISSRKPTFHADHLGVPTRTLMYYKNALDALMAGVTTIRTVGSSDDIDIALRNAINKGHVSGCRIIACGAPIEPYGGHCHITWGTVECSGAADFAKAARIEMGKGVDQVKLMYSGGAGGGTDEGMFDTHITDEEASAVCRVAHMTNRKVVAHLSNDFAIRSALRSGVDSIEHAYSMNEETAAMIAEKGAYYVPTLSVTCNAEKMPTDGLSEHFLRVRNRLIKAKAGHMQSVQYAIKHGVKICVGTDSIPGKSVSGISVTIGEIVLLAEAGLSPLEAIRAGTYNSAELCGLEQVTGSLQAGLAGDITIFKGAPDHNIRDLRNLQLVAKGGKIIWSTLPHYQRAPSCYPYAEDRTDPFADLGNPW